MTDHDHAEETVEEIESNVVSESVPKEHFDRVTDEYQRIITAQGATINAFRDRVIRLEMEIVDLNAASMIQGGGV